MYGAERNRIVRYHFTSIYNKDIINKPLNDQYKSALRIKLGIKEDFIILSVGQIIPRKGYDILIKAIAKINNSNVGCYIVGGEATAELKKLIEDFNLKNIHFINFIDKPSLKEYYLASNIFVHPTREDIWGLVINEAMANGLPVITTDRCIAGLELINSKKIGTIIPSNDYVSLYEAINDFLSRNNIEFTIDSIKAIKNYTFENMAIEHIKILNNI